MEIITTEFAPKAIGPYSQAIKSGNLLFTSGQIPVKPDGTVVAESIEAQVHQVFANLKATLAAAGADLTGVVKVNLFIQDMNDFSRINEVYATYFDTHRPARTTVEVARLPKDVGLELEVIAVC